MYRAHERMLSRRRAPATTATSCGSRSRLASTPAPAHARRFEHVLVDDAQELDLAAASLARDAGAAQALTVAGDPLAALPALPRRRR